MSRFRGMYDNVANRNNTRIDARPKNDEATQAGMRGVHRDMKGNVIGGYTAEGQAIGTKSRFRQMGGGRSLLADGPQTPGLDRLAAMQRTTPAPTFAEMDRQAKDKAAESGAFGAGAQNRFRRRKLYSDMQQFAATGDESLDPKKFGERSRQLGVPQGRFRAAAGKMFGGQKTTA